MKSFVVMPTYNEAENIESIIRRIFELNIPGLSILVVDDNSPDGTNGIVQNLKKSFPHNLGAIVRSGKLGLGSAYISGFNWALQNGADLILEMDADGSHDPNDLPRLIEPAKQGTAEVVIGSRRIKGGNITGWNLYRHLASWSAMSITRLLLGLKTRDVTAGFRCYTRQAMEQLDLASINTNGYAFQEEMVWRCEKNNLKILEIPITFKDRELGKSKLGYRDIIEFFATLMKLKFNAK